LSTNDLAKSPYNELPRQTDLVSKSRLDNVETMSNKSNATVGDEPKFQSINKLFLDNRNGDAQSRVSKMSTVNKADFKSQTS
jgi:hypothetical protein